MSSKIVRRSLTAEETTIFQLSEQLIQAQRPIRVLDSLKWDDSIQQAFFDKKFKELPPVTIEYYQNKPLPFDAEKKLQEFYELERNIQQQLGNYSGVGQIMQRMCREYCAVIRLLQTRGTPEFSKISQSLYGSPHDAFYVSGPNMKDLAVLLAQSLPSLAAKTTGPLDEKKYNGQQTVEILRSRLAQYFNDPNEQISVELNDSMIADAAAGAESLRIRSHAKFSERDLRLLEVHEGWVHLGTTLNGLHQPVCTFLSKGPPSSTLTQEGLAVIMEVFTFSAFPGRLQRLTNRIIAIDMVEQGANFIEVFKFFLENGHSEDVSYVQSVRVFRGSLPEGNGPFSKDLVYSKGFVLIYNYIRLAIQNGLLEQIPLLFLGKTTLEDLPLFVDLYKQGIIEMPKYIPPQFADLAALSSWMSYSLFMNKLDLKKMAMDFKAILR